MPRRLPGFSLALVLLLSTRAFAYDHLSPDLVIRQDIDVNVVLVGFSGLANPDEVVANAAPYNGVPRIKNDRVTMGQRFDFHYHAVAAPPWFEDAFFWLLHQVAVPQPSVPMAPGWPAAPMTVAQYVYTWCNLDPSYGQGCSFDPAARRINRRMITQNYLIDAVFVEKVLSWSLGPALGIDVEKPTVVMINWWGRDNYVDHIYVDPYEPDPETGLARGFMLLGQLAGYGGTASDDPESCAAGDCRRHRLWFYDMSAGPDGMPGSYDLVSPVPRLLGATGLPQLYYRHHHVADYGTPGTYRPLDTLTQDLGFLVGNVFPIDIVAPVALFETALTAPDLPDELVLDINRWNWEPGESFDGLLDADHMVDKMNRLPYHFSARITERNDAPDSRLGDVFDCSRSANMGGVFTFGDSCYGQRYAGYAWGDLTAYFTDHLFEFLTGAGDYEVPIFQFKVPADRAQPFWEGIVDSSLMGFNPPGMGVPTYIYTSTTSSGDHVRGHGHLLTHETGHHVGLTHPFQGGRCLGDACEHMVFFGGPGFYLARAANSVDGIMTYANTNNDFSQFEIDAMRRYRAYDYLDVAGFVVTKIAASPRAASVDAALQAADQHAAAAIAAYQSWDYERAVAEARDAYESVMAAAASINVQVSPQDWRVARKRVIDFNPEFRGLLNGLNEDANQGYAHRTMAEVSPAQ